MGLDNYFLVEGTPTDWFLQKGGRYYALPNDADTAPLAPIVGAFSHGPLTFRGKVYARQLQEDTGYDIHQDQPPSVVRDMATKLKAILAEERRLGNCRCGAPNKNKCDLARLVEMFDFAAQRGCWLIAHG